MVSVLAALDYDARDALVGAVASQAEKGGPWGRAAFAAVSRTHGNCTNIRLALASLRHNPSLAARHLEWAPVGRTQLEASLVGVTDTMLDAKPLVGEWSIRQQLAHVELTYERYGIGTLWASQRTDDDPLRPPEGSYPDRVGDPTGTPGEPLRDIILRLRRVWFDAIAPLVDIPEDRLQRPTEWHGAEHTVAFRLHRFGAHDLEIATDIRRTTAALDVGLTLPRLLAADLLTSWGEIEATLVGVPDTLLDAEPSEGVSLRLQLQALATADREAAKSLGPS